MKLLQLFTLITTGLIFLTGATAQPAGGGEAYPDLHTHPQALKQFQDKRFGMFVHWGPVALRGEEISWSRGTKIPIEEYDQLYREFNPVLFNAEEWVSAAKNAGMKYIILTSRHHDGFSLWYSQFTEYDMASTPYGRGVIQDLYDECKRQDIDLGFYYSICDWYHADYPVTYPDPGYEFHTERDIEDPAVKTKMDRYIHFMKNQLQELVTKYDPPVIWFDGEWEWAWTHEMGMDMYAYLRGIKDDLLINNRVDKGREGMAGTTKSNVFAGDFATPEQQVGKFDIDNAWETCMTIATQWAWKANDQLKSKEECIHTLLQTVGGDGNLLFNVGPMMDGRIEQRQIDRLKEIGDWLKINGEAVYGTRGGPYKPTEKVVSTRNGNKIYLHLLAHPGGDLTLPFPKDERIERAWFLETGSPINVVQSDQLIHLALSEPLPDEIASVVVMKLHGSALDLEIMDGTLPHLPLNASNYHEARGGLANSFNQFNQKQSGKVAFLGGSITYNGGWRDSLMNYFVERFPNTRFEFINAGIPSMGSTPSAFRLERDILSKGNVDLIFIEAAVNDQTNGRSAEEQIRAMEGIIRNLRRQNSAMDIVMMHFVDPDKMKAYRDGKEPEVIINHNKVAAHYNIPTINLAREVTDRIDHGEFSWEKDFVDLHPSPFGQGVYARSIIQFLETLYAAKMDTKPKTNAHPFPKTLDPFCYDRGKLIKVTSLRPDRGWSVDPSWNPKEGERTRRNYTRVPMLVPDTPGRILKIKFTGDAVGIAVAAGPDAGMIEYRIDKGQWKNQNLFTQWSSHLHLPWYYTLASGLDNKRHTLEIRVSQEKDERSSGNACRIRYVYVNE